MLRWIVPVLVMLAAPLRAGVDVQVVTSPQGQPVWLVEDHTLPFIALRLRFEGGTTLDPEGRGGAAYLMTGLLEEGAGARDAFAFQSAREALGAEFGFDVGGEDLTISARMLTETRDAATDLLAEALADPRFDADAVERVRAQVLAGLAMDARNPNAIAGRVFGAALFGDHPYGRPREGTPESVAALTRADLVLAHEMLLTRARVQVSVVGDISAGELGPLVDRLLAGLPEGAPQLPAPVPATLDGNTRVEPFPTPQSVALFALPGVAFADVDFIPAYMLNEIMGGSGVQSRLMQSVREDRGLTYGIYSYLTDRTGAPLWQGAFASGNASMGEAVALVRAEWARLAEDGVTAEELAAVKTYLTGAYPLRFDGNGAIAGILAGLQAQEMTPDYIDRRNALIEAVTLEQINRVARELIDPAALTFVVVGQPGDLP